MLRNKAQQIWHNASGDGKKLSLQSLDMTQIELTGFLVVTVVSGRAVVLQS
jgi:hypothetical protein